MTKVLLETPDREEVVCVERSELRSRSLQIFNWWTKGIDVTHIGYHATSLQAILSFLQTGTFPGYTGTFNQNPALPQSGDIYFIATPEIGAQFDGYIEQESQARKGAIGLARSIASCHMLYSLLGLSIIDGQSQFPYTYNMFPYREFVAPRPGTVDYPEYSAIIGLKSATEMQRIIAKADNARGIVMAMSPKLLDYSGAIKGGSDGDLRVNVSEVPLRDIFIGLNTFGSLERRAFIRLLASYGLGIGNFRYK